MKTCIGRVCMDTNDFSNQAFLDYFVKIFGQILPLRTSDQQTEAFQYLFNEYARDQKDNLVRYGYTIIDSNQLENLEANGFKFTPPEPCSDGQCPFSSTTMCSHECPSMKQGFIPGFGGEPSFPFGVGIYLSVNPPSSLDEGKFVLCCTFLTGIYTEHTLENIVDSKVEVDSLLIDGEMWLLKNVSGVYPVGFTKNCAPSTNLFLDFD